MKKTRRKSYSYESLIGEAMFGDRERGMDRVTCKMVASTQMFCPCGDVLDQESVVVLEVDGKTVKGYCPDCSIKAKEIVASKNYPYQIAWITWNDRK